MAIQNEAIRQAQVKLLRKKLLTDATSDQKTAINYFLPDQGCGCLSKLTEVKDDQYDEVVKRMAANSNSYNRALEKLGLDESQVQEITPVFLNGFESSEYSKTSLDGSYRSNLMSMTYIFFSDTQVHVYKLVLNTMLNEKTETTMEYFYKDITSFNTTVDVTESFMYKGCFGGLKRVQIEIKKFLIVVPGDSFYCVTHRDIEEKIFAMRNKLREKKM